MTSKREIGKREIPRYGDIVSWTGLGMLRMVIAIKEDGLLYSVPLNHHVEARVLASQWRMPGRDNWYIYE
jgi:hypothetical protein